MQISDVALILAENRLFPPDLEMLKPNEARYSCLLLQPTGPIFAGKQRIGPLDQAEATAKTKAFLALAIDRAAHLAIVPEYFSSWAAIDEQICSGSGPAEGALWVLGCESIHAAELEAFKAKVAGSCDVLYEPLANLPADRPLLDPVLFLFQSKHSDGLMRLVALVQFKTFPSRDDAFFEEALLKRGTTVYQFRGSDGVLSVSTIICSDAFALDDGKVPGLVDRATLIHIQLNPDPRNSAYRQYRKTTFETDPATSDCHIICLNWAGAVVEHGEFGHTKDWPAVSGSAWYCPDSRCKCDDDVIVPNHHLGIYYAYMQERRHALLLDYSEAVFELLVPKVVTRGKALLANRNGPAAQERYRWDPDASSWKTAERPIDSGFADFLGKNKEGHTALAHIVKNGSSIDIERLLALTAGKVTGKENWFAAKEIDSCKISADEVVLRVTVPQDTTEAAVDFRHARLAAAAEVRYLLDHHEKWPPQLGGLTKEAQLHWSNASPNFNVRGTDGVPALVVHLGSNGPPPRLENVTSKLVNLLRKGDGKYQERLCIFYRHHGNLKLAPLPFTRFDEALIDETDILSVQIDEKI